MSRSLKKEPFVDENLREKIEKRLKDIAELRKQGGKEKEIDRIFLTPIETRSRDSTIFPEMIGFTIAIHKGNGFTKKQITEKMVNHKLGEFSFTRKIGVHGKAGTS